MQSSKLPIKKSLYAVYLIGVRKKRLSSLQLACKLGIARGTAWRLGHKTREMWSQDALFPMYGELKIDGSCVSGLEKREHKHNRMYAGRGTIGMQPAMGRPQRDNRQIHNWPADFTPARVLQPHIRVNVEPDSTVYTKCVGAFEGMHHHQHEVVAHGVGEYVRDKVGTNEIESIWTPLNREIIDSYQHVSVKRLFRYVDEVYCLDDIWKAHAFSLMAASAVEIVGRGLMRRALVDGDAT
ncbi:MAG: IS1595 family transposase [bacterium]|nr:IS1595 family transposase [bacterium]